MAVLALRELQSAFRRSVLSESGAESALLAEIAGDGLVPGARLAIYRNHVFTTLTDVLMATYPVVCRLVDSRFFRYAADRYIREHLPTSPCLDEYGASLAHFLAAFPPCRHLEFLPDVARLEWAMHAAHSADDAAPLDPARLAEVPRDETPWLRVRLHPSVAYVDSPWPIDAIWRRHQPDGDGSPPVDLATGGARLEIHRRGDDVIVRALDAAAYAFRHALARGEPLAEAADRAFAEGADFSLAHAVRELLDEGLAVDIIPSTPPKEVSRCA
jgi:hypothetical protein